MYNKATLINAEDFLGSESTCDNTETLVEMNTPKQSNDSNRVVPQELIDRLVQEEVAKKLAKEQNDPRQYFDGNTFVPMLLAQEILRELSVITLSDTEEIYFYENGVYKEGGEYCIRQLTQEKLEDKASTHRLKEVVNFIKNEKSVIKNRGDLNRETRIINLKNGLYDLNTGEFRPHTPEFLSTIQIPVNYNPNARSPQINKFLSEVVSEEDRKVLMEFAGYLLIPENKMKKALLIIGNGDNGKTQFINFLAYFIGNKNVSSQSLQSLSNNRFASSNLNGKLLNSYPDLNNSKISLNDTLKCLTGDDLIDVEEKFKKPYKLRNIARLIFGANELPTLAKEEDPFFDRLIIIEFVNKFVGEKADRNLMSKLTTEEELSGFLNEAIEALKELLVNSKYSYNKTTEEVKRIYLVNSDIVSTFLTECVERVSGEKVYKEKMHQRYVEWCSQNNKKPMIDNKFGECLGKKGIKTGRDKTGERKRYWEGLSLI